jgi:hypothetical protein
MPDTITMTATCDAKAETRLFNDGQDRVFLTIRSKDELRRPADSGMFHLYGLCHEVGHLAMYRPIRDHSWMTSAAAEGWAHYIGSHIVDGVYAREGDRLWPDAYDYRAEGTKRLTRELAAADPGPISKGAGLWQDLAGVIGDRKFADLFRAWGKPDIPPANPGQALRKALLATGDAEKLTVWWDKAEPVFVQARGMSSFVARTVKPTDLTGKPKELALDDGAPAGKRSLAGSGHAVRLKTNGDGWYVVGVKVFGSRYGPPRASAFGDFRLSLCDQDFKLIADLPFPYTSFEFNQPKWVTLPVKPTAVPSDFIVCVSFNPTATKGVFVYHDKEGSGSSLTGTPYGRSSPFAEGDWLIRVAVDQLKGADPLKKEK